MLRRRALRSLKGSRALKCVTGDFALVILADNPQARPRILSRYPTQGSRERAEKAVPLPHVNDCAAAEQKVRNLVAALPGRIGRSDNDSGA